MKLRRMVRPDLWVAACTALAAAAFLGAPAAHAQCPGNGSCYEANGTPGCNNTDCCETVCAGDAFCCDTEWDNLCVEDAFLLCGNCGGLDAGSCYVANGTPGCSDEDCCTLVCADDPFCCNTQWDSLCAGSAFLLCGNCGGLDAGSCYESNGSVGCNNEACCEAVCADDPFCCNTTWDGICANDAFAVCGNCGDPAAGSCYTANGTPGCDNAGCCEIVCAADPFCCNSQWDGLCADAAIKNCDNCGNATAGSCYESNGSIGCNNADCCTLICEEFDAFCCEVSWDGICAQLAATECGNCGGADAGNCYVSNGTPGCDDSACCAATCVADPFCCNSQWDGLCAGAAIENCNNCGNPEAGDCFVANGSKGCEIAECCEIVCAEDAFCCDSEWDSLCAAAAIENCEGCGNPNAGSCYEANGTIGCNNAECCEAVCAEDPFCCNNQWDSLCVNGALTICADCGSPAAGSCFVSNGTPGCDSVDCCAIVCDADPFCCNTTWDGLCASAAVANCETAQCLGDLTGDGTVGVPDLLQLLGAWGANPGHPADLDGNNTVGVPDLLLLLGAWGPCP